MNLNCLEKKPETRGFPAIKRARLIFFPNDIGGAALGLQIKLRHIVPKNSETKKLHSAQEKYYAYHGCPPVGGIVVHELAYREQDDCDARKQAEKYAFRFQEN